MPFPQCCIGVELVVVDEVEVVVLLVEVLEVVAEVFEVVVEVFEVVVEVFEVVVEVLEVLVEVVLELLVEVLEVEDVVVVVTGDSGTHKHASQRSLAPQRLPSSHSSPKPGSSRPSPQRDRTAVNLRSFCLFAVRLPFRPLHWAASIVATSLTLLRLPQESHLDCMCVPLRSGFTLAGAARHPVSRDTCPPRRTTTSGPGAVMPVITGEPWVTMNRPSGQGCGFFASATPSTSTMTAVATEGSFRLRMRSVSFTVRVIRVTPGFSRSHPSSHGT
jgi:hypothetical protein